MPYLISFYDGVTSIIEKVKNIILKPGEIIDFIKNIYYYDVNSLYPYIMSLFELPCGKIVYFEGNIYDENLIINNIIPQNVLGFYYCKVIAPTNLLHPIIQLRINNTTLAPYLYGQVPLNVCYIVKK